MRTINLSVLSNVAVFEFQTSTNVRHEIEVVVSFSLCVHWSDSLLSFLNFIFQKFFPVKVEQQRIDYLLISLILLNVIHSINQLIGHAKSCCMLGRYVHAFFSRLPGLHDTNMTKEWVYVHYSPMCLCRVSSRKKKIVGGGSWTWQFVTFKICHNKHEAEKCLTLFAVHAWKLSLVIPCMLVPCIQSHRYGQLSHRNLQLHVMYI